VFVGMGLRDSGRHPRTGQLARVLGGLSKKRDVLQGREMLTAAGWLVRKSSSKEVADGRLYWSSHAELEVVR
jgi:hypothetical protein